jgi:nucleotide-binding universal stress UspA family protein
MYDRIGIALDGSALAEGVLPYVEALAERFGSALTILCATPPPASIVAAEAAVGGIPAVPAVAPTEIAAAEHQQALEHLERVAGRLRGHGLDVQRGRPEGNAAEAILACARRLGADLIAMTTHGRGGLGRLVLGSVADEVLRGASRPVLLVRVKEESA